ncbi:DUF3616 domain-containing protein [Methylocystis sp.]|uniref:DUF3616 domain-containing protein n=1 Tax=Methylocystis sp. TaxID=1911079 RepID=UPI003D0C365C
MNFSASRFVVLAAAASLCPSALAAELCPPESTTPWSVSAPAFSKADARENISGFVCAPDAPDYCLVVADEGREAAFVSLHEGGLAAIGAPFALPVASHEFDAEGATTDGKFLYIAGSQSVKRRTCEDHPANRVVLRFDVDPARRPPVTIKSTGELWKIIESLPEFAGHAGPNACLGDNSPQRRPDLPGKQGVNIEGVAAKDGRLYFGFRGPAIDGEALLLGVDAKALFEGGVAAPSVARIKVGKKRAIRDLTIADGALLALVGPDDDNLPLNYSVFRIESPYQGSARAAELAALDLDKAPRDEKGEPIKPEAIALLDATPERYRLLVLSDGGEDGAPLVFNIPRRP